MVLPIVHVSAEPLDLTLTEPFGIAQGAQVLARNVLVRVRLADGTEGLGEAAPFPAVSGETQERVLAALVEHAPRLIGEDARAFRRHSRWLREALADVPSALCGLETALLDAWARQRKVDLWSWFGGAESELESDITIPTGSPGAAAASATSARDRGFTVLKVKVGGVPLEADIERLRHIVSAAPRARLILDANASFTSEQALELLREVSALGGDVALFEQPTARDDLEGLAQVRRDGRVAVAADESARSLRDLLPLWRGGAADVVNLKITKSGLHEALEMASAARGFGFGLMIGGMVESPLAMTVSACLAAGLGSFRFVDLDTPWFMTGEAAVGPASSSARRAACVSPGAFVDHGPRLQLGHLDAGHGVTVESR